MHRLIIDRSEPLHHLRDEWLLTSGLGGFAFGTALGANTRRYHGLLVASMLPPLGRVVALHSVIEQLVTPDGPVNLALPRFELATPGVATAGSPPHGDEPSVSAESPYAMPAGQKCSLLRFEAHPPLRALWVYRVGQVVIEKELTLRPGTNDAELAYCLRHIPGPMTLRLRPLVALRDYHSLRREADGPPDCDTVGRNGFTLTQNHLKLTIEGLGGASCERITEPQWWRNFTYEEDAKRGQDFTEDVWSPGLFEAKVTRSQADIVLLKAHASHVQHTWPDPPKPWTKLPPPARSKPSVQEQLRIAADQFIARRFDQGAWHSTVLAGFPWFADWGRDTMISLPGLLIAPGRLDDARSTLALFARHRRRGLVPNRFDDYGGTPEYNTVDASLWFVHAVHALHQADASLVDEALRAACVDVITHYRDGTDFGIHMERDGLIVAGGPDTQLTWMDARRDGIAFTPRNGKPVEIAALWHHALRCVVEMMPGEPEADEFAAIADRARESFQAFWCEEHGCLYDVLSSTGGDARIRPNQLLAVSLEHSPLAKEQQQRVVAVARERLLTPFGLRTLAPGREGYVGRYEGDMMQRDRAYHNGTVWPWLIGPYCEALLRAHDFSDDAKTETRNAVMPLTRELDTGCLGQLAEIYDGDAPHRASGCPAQAWSVAEVLRVMTLLG